MRLAGLAVQKIMLETRARYSDTDYEMMQRQEHGRF
jgi:hypothetical protein